MRQCQHQQHADDNYGEYCFYGGHGPCLIELDDEGALPSIPDSQYSSPQTEGHRYSPITDSTHILQSSDQ